MYASSYFKYKSNIHWCCEFLPLLSQRKFDVRALTTTFFFHRIWHKVIFIVRIRYLLDSATTFCSGMRRRLDRSFWNYLFTCRLTIFFNTVVVQQMRTITYKSSMQLEFSLKNCLPFSSTVS